MEEYLAKTEEARGEVHKQAGASEHILHSSNDPPRVSVWQATALIPLWWPIHRRAAEVLPNFDNL